MRVCILMTLLEPPVEASKRATHVALILPSFYNAYETSQSYCTVRLPSRGSSFCVEWGCMVCCGMICGVMTWFRMGGLGESVVIV
ncbi:hypothetical protein J3E72DRAFT_281272 [Bipolaris maydis]|nr:hypothetical protein J3E72DRAFT_281272 [Bipolaris maydis]